MHAHIFFIHDWNFGFKELFKQYVKWLLIEMQVSNSENVFITIMLHTWLSGSSRR